MIQENTIIELRDVSFQVEEVYVVPSTVNEKECYQLNIVKFQEKKNNHIDHSLQNTKDEKKVNTDFEGRNTKDADTEWFPFSH